ncbi:MAG: acyltransferase [Lachnospiraceae bacterium]|nr:acyltransferase [Lachnospiraceae bacterium]
MKNQKLQGLRGIAALVVFVSHVLLEGRMVEWMNRTPLGVFISGSAAVMVFFFLSGYFAYKEDGTAKGYLQGMKRKIKKIYPPYLLALGLGLVGYTLISYHPSFDPYFGITLAHSWKEVFTWKELAIQSLMFVTLNRATVLDPPIWTMIIEIRAVFLLPLIYYPMVKFPCFKKTWVTIFYLTGIIVGSHYANTSLGISFFHWLPAFVLGGGLHHMIRQGGLSWLKDCKLPYTVVLSILSICLISFGALHRRAFFHEDYVYDISELGCFILVALILSNGKGLSWLANKGLVLLGNVSYYFYLIHWIVLAALRPLVVWGVETVGSSYYICYDLYVMVALVLSFGVALGMQWIFSFHGKKEKLQLG